VLDVAAAYAVGTSVAVVGSDVEWTMTAVQTEYPTQFPVMMIHSINIVHLCYTAGWCMNICCLLRIAKTLPCKYNSFTVSADRWIHRAFITDTVHLQTMLYFGYAVRCSVESFPTFPANVIRPLKMS
jgi:hypothetical protein